MEVKTEELLRGALRIIQPDEKSGPRVNVDTILLANFTNPKAGERILEIGLRPAQPLGVLAPWREQTRGSAA